MKIAFLSSFAHVVLDAGSKVNSGGAELQVALLARELTLLGHHVVLLGGDTGQPDGAIFEGVRVRNAGKFHTGRMLEMLTALPRVVRILREERPDFVFVLGWTAWLFVLWLLRRPLGFRLGYICGLDTEVNGEFERKSPLLGGLFVFAMKRCDVRFAMTRHQQAHFRRRHLSCGFYRNLILARASPPPAHKTTDFLWVSRCRAIKRPEIFVELARRLPGARCEMICPPEDRALYEKIENEARQLPNLHLLPGVPYHAAQRHYDSARVFVNTSEWEGWPNSFIQAGLGRAALLSLSVRPDSLFDDFALGVACDGDLPRFFQEAQSLFHSPQKTEKMGAECARFVAELHENSRETRKFLDEIDSSCSHPDQPTNSPT